MPKLTLDDNRYTFFLTRREHVLEAASDLLNRLDENNEALNAFIKTAQFYKNNYAKNPQITVDFLNLLKSKDIPALLPKNELQRLQKALEDDQKLMSERNVSYINKRNSLIDTIQLAAVLLSVIASIQLEDTDAKLQIMLLGSLISLSVCKLKINDSVNNWDYVREEDTNDIECGHVRDFHPMQIS